MMHTAPLLHLTLAQLMQLLGYCASYRGLLWQHSRPTAERNQTMRNVQALQGRLEKAREQGSVELVIFSVSVEEKHTIQKLLRELTQMYAQSTPSAQRTQQLSEITGCRVAIERMLRQTS